MSTLAPCESSPDCLHPTCQTCDRPIRHPGFPLNDHPGTVSGRVRTRLCVTHFKATIPKPSPLARPVSHNNIDFKPLTDEMLSRMSMTHRPSAEYIEDRRIRNIPVQGITPQEGASH